MKKIIASFLILSGVLCLTLCYFTNLHKGISSNLIRMHIIANSDSSEDQKIKIEIRDRILEKYSFAAQDVKGEKEYIENNIEDINSDVNLWLKEKGMEYGAKSCLTLDYFPTKSYGGLNLPKGQYTAFKIILGEGAGKNWWCVMFPPLCFADSSVGKIDAKSDEYLKSNLSDEEYSLVTGKKTSVKFKFLELINGI